MGQLNLWWYGIQKADTATEKMWERLAKETISNSKSSSEIPWLRIDLVLVNYTYNIQL